MQAVSESQEGDTKAKCQLGTSGYCVTLHHILQLVKPRDNEQEIPAPEQSLSTIATLGQATSLCFECLNLNEKK